MPIARFPVLFACLLGVCGCEGSVSTPREPATVRVEHIRRGGYLLLRGDDSSPITEREFARMYKNRTGSNELDPIDHTHDLPATAGGLVVGGALLASAAAVGAVGYQRCETGDHCATVTTGVAFLGVLGALVTGLIIAHARSGAPEQHEIPRNRAEYFVEQYNARVFPDSSQGAGSTRGLQDEQANPAESIKPR